MFTSSRLRDWGLLLVCNLLWGSQYAFLKIIMKQMGPVFATFFPAALSMLILIPMVRRQERRKSTFTRSRKMPTRDVLAFMITGIFGMAAAQLLIVWGVRLSLASDAALVVMALPIVTAVIAYFFLGERMTPRRWISFALAAAGVVECSGINWKVLNFTSGSYLLGNMLVFAGISGNAFYNVYSKKLLSRYSPLQVLVYSYYAGVAFLLLVTLYAEPQSFRDLPHFSLVVWLSLIELSVFGTCLAMGIFLYVLTRLDATQAALSNYLIPLFGVLLAVAMLHERLTSSMALGGILVLAGTLLVTV